MKEVSMAKAGDKEVIKLEEVVEEEEEVSVVIEQPEKEGRDGEEGSSYSGKGKDNYENERT